MKKSRFDASKKVIILNTALNLLVIGILIRSLFLRYYDNAFVCIAALLLFTLPAFIKKTFHVKLPETLEVIVLLFIFSAEILGELQCYYIQFEHWDTMLHTVWGFLCAALGFSLVDIINRDDKIKFHLSPVFVAIVAFCFSMTIGVLWEFFEFGADQFLHTDMQKDTAITEIYSTELDPEQKNKVFPVTGIENVNINDGSLVMDSYLDIGLYDTMEDLCVNFIGAFAFSIIGYFYIKKRGQGKFARRFIPVIDNDESEEKSDDNKEQYKMFTE